MHSVSAGLLMYRQKHLPEFFLIHPGGPFYARKNEGVWSIPKGLVEVGEDLEATAQREFSEETGIIPSPPYHPLGSIQMKTGKIIHAWAFAGEWEEHQGIVSNTFDLEWPPKSGRIIKVPEADRGAWMKIEEARVMINKSQVPFLERASQLLI